MARSSSGPCKVRAATHNVDVGCSIVIVDDEPDFADGLAALLRGEGHEVSTFPTPDDAVDWLLGGGRAGLVLLDLRTPGISAQRFQALLMSTDELRELPVVVVSGSPDAHKTAHAIGACATLEKPVDIDRVLSAVDRYCRHHEPAALTC